MQVALGVDIGGTNTAFGLCDREGNIYESQSIPTTGHPDALSLIKVIQDRLASSLNSFELLGIGIGAPNGNYFTGSIEFAPNLEWEGQIPLASYFQECFGVPAVLTNDANAAAIGEMIYGNAKDLTDFVEITLGTGLGSGIVVNNQLIYGHDGFAGEYGHISVIPNGRICGCGRKGCLETYASATGVVRSIQELASENKSTSSLLSLDSPTGLDLFKAYQKGDTFAGEIIQYTADILGNALANFACFSNPKAYVLFGGIAQSGSEFASLVKRSMEQNILNIYQDRIEIRVSGLHDKNAAVLGSSSLVWKEME